ncbi:hypothetical protein [Rhizohabitans arisaemae]|uniref:hypothetical protein n=1 Tax=Rhizohabitans arisaemae TaxID=2720610 RepID=UPI0024B0F491|nr:hypothetical protein [Rhizohabitans arisaemae]
MGVVSTLALSLAAVSASLASAADLPPQAGPKPAPEGDSGYISNIDRVRAAAQAPLVRAAEQIHGVVEAGNDAGFAGIELGQDRVLVWWKGVPAKAVQDAVGNARRTAVIEVGEAAHSRKELEAAAGRLWAAAGVTAGGPVHGVRIPFDGSGLAAAVEEGNKAAVTQAESRIPGDLGVPVKVFGRDPLKRTGRCDDRAPWYGGAAIRNTSFGFANHCGGTWSRGYTCTAGFAVRLRGLDYLLTAGHCGRPRSVIGDSTGEAIGNMTHEHVGHDLALIRADGGSAGRIWDGKPGVGDFTKPVIGWLRASGGQWLCMSGSTTGAQCGYQVDGRYSTLCDRDVDGTYECYYGLLSARSHYGVPSRNGDSGGPVFQLDVNADQVFAVGTVVGYGGDRLVFQDFATARYDWPGLTLRAP